MSAAASRRRARPSRAAGLLVNLSLSLAAIALTLLAAEAGVRLLTRTGPALLVSDPVVGRRFQPGFAGRVYVPECGCEVDLRFNRDGLRGPDRPYSRPRGVTRVALVGDSMVAAIATAEERTLASRLERLLGQSHPARRFEVINAGVSSSSTGSELVLYREVVARYAPGLVVLVFWVGNDLADNSAALTRGPRFYFDFDQAGRLFRLPYARPSAGSAWLNRASRLYVWQKQAVRQALASWDASRGGLEPVELVYARPEPAAVARAWAITAALFAAFRDETRVHGAELVVVVAPTPAQVYDDLWAELESRAAASGQPLGRERPEQRVLELCRRAGIPCLALAEAFRAAAPGRDSRRREEQLFHRGRFHWNDAGNALAAEEVHAFLAGRVLESGGNPGREAPASGRAPSLTIGP